MFWCQFLINVQTVHFSLVHSLVLTKTYTCSKHRVFFLKFFSLVHYRFRIGFCFLGTRNNVIHWQASDSLSISNGILSVTVLPILSLYLDGCIWGTRIFNISQCTQFDFYRSFELSVFWTLFSSIPNWAHRLWIFDFIFFRI